MNPCKTPADLVAWREQVLASRTPQKRSVTVCGGTGCRAMDSAEIKNAFVAELKAAGLEAEVELKVTGCRGFCEQGPLVEILPEGIFYMRVKPKDVPQIVNETLLNGTTIPRLLFKDPQTGQAIPHDVDIPFYSHQTRLLLKNSGVIDPESIEDYLAVGGYAGLAKALFEMKPEDVLEEVKRSGLRGRGGAGFPTGVKWETTRKEPGKVKYVICNADEGDPGAYQDRNLSEGNPHSILEGMLIGAYAIGATEGFIYVRHEYGQAVEHLRLAVKVAEEAGLLGENILGSGFGFKIHVQEGAGAFVCGEETALIASLEGQMGVPHPKPPFPSVSGLWGKPTNINNVKSWATIPQIILHGSDWFRTFGTPSSPGTMVFSLVGQINNTGLVEVPMGISLRNMVYDIGGGLRGNGSLKAIQTGGPSGGCIPAEMADLTVDYESLGKVGAIMGSGAMIVMDQSTCMVDIARYFLEFTRFESCGKCTACREGIAQMYDILVRITQGDGQEGDIEMLEELGKSVKEASLCGLGKSAPNPVLTTIRYFRNEYEAHINNLTCPAGVCRSLITFSIDPEKCNGCTLCWRNCPEHAISGEPRQTYSIDSELCVRCGICRDVCNRDAVVVQ